jgi:hypothetical protein
MNGTRWGLAVVSISIGITASGLLVRGAGWDAENLLWLGPLVYLVGLGLYAVSFVRPSRRRPPTRDWTATSSVAIGRSRTDVWEALLSVDVDHMINPSVVAFKVPKTPEGLGEERVFIRRDPTDPLVCTVSEIVGMDEGRRIEVRCLTHPELQTYELEDLADGTLVRMTYVLSAKRFVIHRHRPSAIAERICVDYLTGLKAALEFPDALDAGVPG